MSGKTMNLIQTTCTMADELLGYSAGRRREVTAVPDPIYPPTYGGLVRFATLHVIHSCLCFDPAPNIPRPLNTPMVPRFSQCSNLGIAQPAGWLHPDPTM